MTRLPPYSGAAAAARRPNASKPAKPAATTVSHLKAPSTGVSSWGCGFAAPNTAEPQQEEQCPAATPHASPSITPSKSEGRPPAAVKSLLKDDSFADPPFAGAGAVPQTPPATASLPSDARVALEHLAGRLGAAASSGAGLADGTWEEAFLAGVTVGLALPSAGRRSSAGQRTLVAVLVAGMLLVLCASALLLAGITQTHPTVYFQ